MADLFLAIDVGSTSVKAAVFDGSGQCRSRFAQSYPTARPRSTEATQNPDDWMGLIRAALAQFASEGLGGAVGFGSMCSHVNTHVFVDKNGAALAPAILWQDIRAAREAAELDAMITQADKIKYLGAPIAIDASHPLARMAWMARNHPEIWQQTAYVLLPKDYCLWHLTGVLATDPLSNVGLVGPDLRYVGPILDLLDGAAQRMAPLRGITDSIGQIAPAFELRGVQMVNGTMDGWMGLYGAGAGQAGDMVYLSGTSEILGTSSPHAAGTAGIMCFPILAACACTRGQRNRVGHRKCGFARLLALIFQRCRSGCWIPRAGAQRRCFCPNWRASVRPCGTPTCAVRFWGWMAAWGREIWPALCWRVWPCRRGMCWGRSAPRQV
jgi:xylulokinase